MIPIIIKWVKDNQEQVILAVAIVAISLVSFNIGRIYTISSMNKAVEYTSAELSLTKDSGPASTLNNEEKTKINPSPALDLRVIVSKKSTTKKYHFLWCPGAKQMNEANKIYFASEQEAQTAGYSLAGNCRM